MFALRPHIRVSTCQPRETSVKRLLLLLWRMSKTDLRLLWFALRRHDRPGWLLPVTAALGLYAVAPFNFVVPVLGIADDLVLVPLLLHQVLKLLPPTITQGFASRRRAPGFG
jgi:uncharacterized membrane protein YkvA (DUF1232 family)